MSDLIFRSFRLVILDEFNIHFAIPLRSPDKKIYVCARGLFFPPFSSNVFFPHACKGHILDLVFSPEFLEYILYSLKKRVSILMHFLFGYLGPTYC